MVTHVQGNATKDTESVDRITIHSPRLNCNAYLIELLNGGIWLSERLEVGKHRKRSIKILLYPVGSPRVRWSRRMRALADPLRVLYRTCRNLVGRVRSLESKLGPRTGHQGSTIIERVCMQSSGAYIQVDETVTISIQGIEAGYAESALLTMMACIKALRILRGYRQNGRLNAQAFLRLRHRDVHIGDLVASETIAASPAAGGSLQRCGMLALFWCLVDAIYTVDYILGQTWNLHDHDYVTTSETTYLDEIYRRTLRSCGLSILELYDYTGQLRIIAPGEEWPNPFVARAWQGAELSRHQRECAQQHLAERVADPGRHLWDMYVGRNSCETGPVLDERGRIIARDDRSLTVIVFLHCFDDAQYWSGLDGFEDLYEWTEVSIDECLSNPHIGRILLKEHPNVDTMTFSGNRRAVERLRDRYQHEPRMTFLNRHTNIQALTSLGAVYGITNFGRVAEELVAVGLPVIASSKGPWGKRYPFLRMWDSPDEYAAMLRSLTPAGWRPPGNAEREALAQFVHEFRLTVLSGQDRPMWLQWMLWADPSVDVLDCDISDKVERRVAELEPDSPHLVKWLRERTEAYCESRNTGICL